MESKISTILAEQYNERICNFQSITAEQLITVELNQLYLTFEAIQLGKWRIIVIKQKSSTINQFTANSHQDMNMNEMM